MASFREKLINQAKRIGAQLNPFDGGATYKNSQPAQPRPATPRVNFNDFQRALQGKAINAGRQGLGLQFNAVKRFTPTPIKDIFDANTLRDQQKRLQAGQPRLYVDQKIQAGNARPFTNLGQQLAGNTARTLNTLAAVPPELVGTVRQTAATLTKNPVAAQNANAFLQGLRETAYAPKGGLLNVGTIFDSPEQINTIGARKLLTKVVGNVAGTAGEVLPGAATGKAIKRVGASALSSGLGSAGQQLFDTGRINPKQAAGDVAAGVALGEGGTLLKKLLPILNRTPKGVASEKLNNIKATMSANKASKLASKERADLVNAFKKMTPNERADIADYLDTFPDPKTGKPKYNIDGTSEFADLPKRIYETKKKYGITFPASRSEIRKIIEEAEPKFNRFRLNNKGSILVDPNQSELIKIARKIKGKQPSYNTKNLVLNKKEKVRADALVKELDKSLKDKIGPRLSNKEVVDAAESGAVLQAKGINRNATKSATVANLKLRQSITKGLKEEKISSDTIKLMLKDKAVGADIARQLQARKIQAVPEDRRIIDLMLDKIYKAGVATDEVVAASKNFDLNDPQQQAEFFRNFVKPKAEDWIDKYRYTNMLSSPITHISNMFSNLTGAGPIRALTKGVEGGIDYLRSGITSKPRTRFAGEGGAYLKGTIGSFGDAVKSFTDVMKGVKSTTNLDTKDLNNLPLATKGAKAQIDKILSKVPTLLEAGDQFSQTLVKGGESAALNLRKSRGIKVGNISKKAQEAADYTAFRKELGGEDQGRVLQALDTIPSAVNSWKNSQNPIIRNVSKLTFPFISTPTNVFKQGVEYSPLGITTLWGSKDKTAQVAKATIGTAVTGIVAGSLAAGGDITFGEPSNKEQRDAFRAEGKLPYSVKIGNKWVSYSKLHPAIAFNFATVAAVKDALDKGSINDSQAEKLLNSAAGIMGYLTDQSYMKNVGDAVSVIQSKDGSNWSNILSNQSGNAISQLIPFKSMVSWIGRSIDPTQRRVDYGADMIDQLIQTVTKDIPLVNKNIPTRTNPYTGEPLKSSDRLINMVSPLRVSTDKGYGNTTGLSVDQRLYQNQLPKQEQESYRRGIIEQKALDKDVRAEKEAIKKSGEYTVLKNGQIYGKVGDEFKTFETENDYKVAAAKDVFKKSGKKIAEYEGIVFYKNKNGDVFSKSKDDYLWEQREPALKLDMDTAYESNDLKTWINLAGEKYDRWEAQKAKYDPETESGKILELTIKQQNLLETVDKYQKRGYTKRGGGKGGRSSKVKIAKLRSIKIGKVPKIRSVRARQKSLAGLKISTRKPKKVNFKV